MSVSVVNLSECLDYADEHGYTLAKWDTSSSGCSLSTFLLFYNMGFVEQSSMGYAEYFAKGETIILPIA